MHILFRLLGFVKPHRKLLFAAYAATLISTALSLAVPRLLGTSVDRVIERGELRFLLYTGLAIIGVTLVRAVFSYLEQYLRESLSQRVTFDLRNLLYNHLQRLSFAYHDSQQTGNLMARATADVENVRWFVNMGLLRTFNMLVLVAGVAALLIGIDWRLALMCLGFIPFVLVRGGFIARKLRKIWSRAQDINGELESIVQENLTGMKVVKAFARRDHEIAKFSSKALDLMQANIAAIRVQATNTPLMNFLFTGLIALMLWYGGQEIVKGTLTAGELTQFILYLAMLQMPVRMTGFLINLLSRAGSSGKRIFDVLDAESPVQEKAGATPLERVQGRVTFDHVSFTYTGASPVLHEVTFEAQPGQVIALVGTTGSGKTTIVHLLPRFYDVSGGAVRVDGKDVRDVTLASLRRSVGIVQQDVFLFSATIRDNIAYGKVSATDEEVRRAAQAARLDEFIEGLPDGYATWVGERGITLSGGQKQRVAIARTLLLDPPVLVLDDSTSSVDTRTEHQIRQALEALMRGRTTFVIAQRLSSVKRADLILVLEEGRVVQRGTHAALVAMPGPYQEIYELQLRPQEEAGLAAEQGARL